jgi:hypothetical protein
MITSVDPRPQASGRTHRYLENILQLRRPECDSCIHFFKPPPSSPPRYAVWVNSLHVSAVTTTGQPTPASADVNFFYPPRQLALSFGGRCSARPTTSFLFLFAGLLILLKNINHIVFDAVAVWITLCVAVYTYITFLPIFQTMHRFLRLHGDSILIYVIASANLPLSFRYQWSCQ